MPIKKYPSGFYSVCFAQIGERFSFYAMRGILVLYMVKNFSFTNEAAYTIFSLFTALLYLTPYIGGLLADYLFGKKKSILLGGCMLSMGYFLLYFLEKNHFYLALSLIALGNGFFMPNVISYIGHLYDTSNPHLNRESGFSIFYTATNIGAFLPPFFLAGIIAWFGWQASFLISAITAFISTLIFLYGTHPSTPNTKKLNFNKKSIILPLTLTIITSFTILFYQLMQASKFATIFIFSSSVLFFLYTIKKSFSFSVNQRNRLLMGLFLTAFSVIFWMLSEQTAMSLTIYTEYNVRHHIFNHTIPVFFFFSLNPFFIILLGPLFAKLWRFLEKKNLNPSIPKKFAIGTILMGLGFAIIPLGIAHKDAAGQISIFWIIVSYFFQSCGELVFSPIGLSMMTELSPKSMVGSMVGIWYLATAVAYLLAGLAAKLTTLPSATNLPLTTSPIYAHTFASLGWLTIAAGIIIWFFSPIFKNIVQR